MEIIVIYGMSDTVLSSCECPCCNILQSFFFEGYILLIALPLHANFQFPVMICNLKLTIYVRFICNNSVLILKVLVKNKTSNINSNNIFCHMLSVTLRMTGALQKTSPGADGPSPITSFPLKSIY